MIETLRRIFTLANVLKYARKYNELLLLPIGILLWLFSPVFIHSVDETAATYDFAVFQKLIFGLVVFSFSTFNVWIILRITFPGIFRYLTETFDNDLSTLNENKCDKLKISLAVYALYLLALLLAMQVL